MLPEQQADRPRAVTVIGWILLVLASLSLLRSLANLIIWKVIQPAVPSLLGVLEAKSPQTRFLRPLLEHLTTVIAFQAILSIMVGVAAWEFLRLRAWARIVVQAICWIGLFYLAAFAVLWIVIWAKAPVPSGLRNTIAFAAGLAICLALIAGMAVTVSWLRTPRVREAFIPGRREASGR